MISHGFGYVYQVGYLHASRTSQRPTLHLGVAALGDGLIALHRGGRGVQADEIASIAWDTLGTTRWENSGENPGVNM